MFSCKTTTCFTFKLNSNSFKRVKESVFRQDSHLLSQVTNNNTPALVAQALSGEYFMYISYRLSQVNAHLFHFFSHCIFMFFSFSFDLQALSGTCTFFSILFLHFQFFLIYIIFKSAQALSGEFVSYFLLYILSTSPLR